MATSSEDNREYEQALDRGYTALREGDSAEAITLFQRAADLGQNDAQIADALALLGRAYGTVGQFDRAEDMLQNALRRAANDPGSLARVKMQMGIVRYQTGQYDAATYFLEEAEQEFERLDARRDRCIALGNIGTVRLTRGDYQQAIDALRTAVDLSEPLGDLTAVTVHLSNMGETYFELGDPAGAQELHERAIRLSELLGSESLQADQLRNLGMDIAAQGRVDEGRALVERSMTLAQNSHQEDTVRQCQVSLAEVQLMMGEYDAAQSLAQRLLSAVGDSPVYRAQAQLIIGRCQLARHQPQRAQLTLESALVDAQVTAHKLLVLRLHAALAQVDTHPAVAAIHRRIAAETASQIAASLTDGDLREKFMQSALYKSVVVQTTKT